MSGHAAEKKGELVELLAAPFEPAVKTTPVGVAPPRLRKLDPQPLQEEADCSQMLRMVLSLRSTVRSTQLCFAAISSLV